MKEKNITRPNPALKSALARSAMVRELKELVDFLNEDPISDPPKEKLTYPSEAHFVLVHGRLFKRTRFPKDLVTMKMPRSCFWNAHFLAKRYPEQYRYVEGFSSIKELYPRPSFHGWVIDEKDRVIDPTWDNNGVEYFGVEFSREYVEKNEPPEDPDPYEVPGWNSLVIGQDAILMGRDNEEDWKPKRTSNKSLAKAG
jgi:hypothetical protein